MAAAPTYKVFVDDKTPTGKGDLETAFAAECAGGNYVQLPSVAHEPTTWVIPCGDTVVVIAAVTTYVPS